jgi:hypothetical protein
LAINRGGLHTLTPRGRYEADRIGREIAQRLGMHVVSYDLGGAGRAPKAFCSCGEFAAFRSKAIPGWLTKLTADAEHHRRHVAARDEAGDEATLRKTVEKVG